MISTDTPANVIDGSRPAHDGVRIAMRGPRFVALVGLSAYLAVSGVLLASSGHALLAAMHAAGIALAAWGQLDRSRLARVVGDLLPLVAAPALYGEIPLLITALGPFVVLRICACARFAHAKARRMAVMPDVRALRPW